MPFSFFHYILTGNFGDALPRYLRKEYYKPIRSGLDRLTLFQGSVENAAAEQSAGGFDGYNLSDVFEYLDAETCSAMYGTLLQHANAGARFAYWNMLVPRRCGEDFPGHVTALGELSGRLHQRDMAFFYSAFILEEVR